MSIGVCYFPEHWPRERWATDVAQMAEAGIEHVRMGEFAWSRIEDDTGEVDLSWLDEVLDLLEDHDMEAVLCTPTATPPMWLVENQPEILQEEADGTVRHYGSRRHYCFNSPVYREETERIVSLLAEHFAGDSRVEGWQVDNEFGCHRTVRCYCADCSDAFSDWLRATYGDVDALNEAWGTDFWSQTVHDFDAVEPPRHAPTDHHPARLLDYYRFASDSVVSYNRLQAEVLRDADDSWFVCHNFMGARGLDEHDVGGDLDLAAWDSYPTGNAQDMRTGEATPDEHRAGDPDGVGVRHDEYRALLDRPFWVMEQQPGDVNWPPYGPQPAEGAMRLWAHHAVAHGAEKVLYFRWRRCRQGQEQYHAGLLTHDGRLDRGYHDAQRAAAELPDLDHVDAPVAILADQEDEWAIEVDPHSPDVDYRDHLQTYYRAVRARGPQVDVVHPETDLGDYDAVVAPMLHLVDEALASRLEAFVAAGGHLLLTIRSGFKDLHGKLPEDPVPGPLADLAGLTVERHESMPPVLETRTSYRDGVYEYERWAEWLDPGEAAVLGRHETGVAAGSPAIAEHGVGDGRVTYVGVWPGRDLADRLAGDLLDRAGVPRLDPLPDGVRVTERDGHAWVTNFTSDPVSVDAPADATFLVGDERVGPYDFALLEASYADLALEQ